MDHTITDNWDMLVANLASMGYPFVAMEEDKAIPVADAVRLKLEPVKTEIERLQRFVDCCCDKPEDRMYHAKDATWWKRVGNSWKATDAPDGWLSQVASTDLLDDIVKIEELRDASGCPPDCDLLSWVKMLNRMHEDNCNGEGE